MPTWHPAQYLRFADERARPCRELVARIALDTPRRIVDLGCGPGNSTGVLAERWPEAECVGVDSSETMIAVAEENNSNGTWLVCDIADWAAKTTEQYDLVFSNAALHWLPHQNILYPRLLSHATPGGAFAVQVPADITAPEHHAMRIVAESKTWRAHFPAKGVREWFTHDPSFYYDLLAPRAATVDLWETTYMHVLPNAAAIVEWYRGSGLRPFLDALASDKLRNRFLADYQREIEGAFPMRTDGRVVMPMRRLFFIAYRD